jgi:hypothetical protein
MKWVTVKKMKDCPPNDDYEDYPEEYVVRIMHDDGRGGNTVCVMKASEIWPCARENDGAVMWLNESKK